ncbi:amidohydrolase [Bordetella sp. LUAb4]|uniref:amidohydrolase family protein n=1 Tax=Bordetella sp. LUAb4 TaxID=2843195 RepID=UPI001E293CBE|nr:amidohydrolase family protein [Bordetella sp. LUAb4]
MSSSRTILNVQHSDPGASIPRGACDCHVHIFGPFDRYPLAADRVFMPGVASTDDLLALHAALGVDRVVIVQASPQGTDNRCMTDALRTLNDAGHAARGVAVLAPDISVDDLHALHAAGVRGARVNLQSYGQQDPAVARDSLMRTAAQVADLGWHVQIYSNLSVISAMARTLADCPVPVVIDHFALASAVMGPRQPGLKALLQAIADGNIYVKLSAPYRLTTWEDGRPPSAAGDIARAFIDTRLDRMLWGTDWPHTGAWPGQPRLVDRSEPLHPIDDGLQLAAFRGWVNDQEKQAILVDNPARLYQFG